MRYTVINKDWSPIETLYGSPPNANDLLSIDGVYYTVLQVIHKKTPSRFLIFFTRTSSEVYVVVEPK